MAKLKAVLAGLSPGSRRALKTVLGLFLGALLGYAYYAFVGCNGGGCSVAANPWVMTVTGAVFGVLLVGEQGTKQ
jgi:hypothetical protein